MKKLILFFSFLFVFTKNYADEGMWIPLLLGNGTIQDMQAKGLKLNAEDIYSINQASLKDAIPIFGGGCTSSVISNEGLLITNHHCGYSQIQKHSSLEHNYLDKGFWAKNKDEELTNRGLKVTFLIKMQEVTSLIDSILNTTPNISKKQIIDSLENIVTDTSHYKGKIKDFYFGNRHFLFITETFEDVRLVGAPPSSIGKFGGDTDNWMWPRHTGDFCLFRIYADKNNRPAKYSPDNVPYKPRKFVPISLKGVQKNDFTMIIGYPGSTQQYLTSYAVDAIQNQINPARIALREARISAMKKYMEKDPEVRIKYAVKYARVSNYSKKWKGENNGLRRLNAIEVKQKNEKLFQEWANKQDTNNKYVNLLANYQKIYTDLNELEVAKNYLFEGIFGTEIIPLAAAFTELAYIPKKSPDSIIENATQNMINKTKSHFKNYHLPIDKEVTLKLFKLYHENLPSEYQPKSFYVFEKKYKGDWNKYIDDLFEKSILINEKKLLSLLEKCPNCAQKKILKDPFFILFEEFVRIYYSKLKTNIAIYQEQLDQLDHQYINALQAMYPQKHFYADANFTMRVAYGKIDSYEPRDAVFYRHFTTLEGVIEKEDSTIYDYKVPQKLKEIYKNKNYGIYAENKTMHVCFTASNHTTGGNSGSPIFNANGELIGVNFDRNWEGTMSDIMYDPNQCRNISVDIRYVLFIIDKFAGAGYLLDEMELITP